MATGPEFTEKCHFNFADFLSGSCGPDVVELRLLIPFQPPKPKEVAHMVLQSMGSRALKSQPKSLSRPSPATPVVEDGRSSFPIGFEIDRLGCLKTERLETNKTRLV